MVKVSCLIAVVTVVVDEPRRNHKKTELFQSNFAHDLVAQNLAKL